MLERGGWELIASLGAGTFVCLLITGREIDTETCEVDNVFPPDDIWFTSDNNTNSVIIYNFCLHV